MKYAADPSILELDDLAAIAWGAIEPIWDDLPLHPHGKLAEFMATLTEGQRALIALDWCQKELRNGGVRQLLGNPAGNLVPYGIGGFRLVGAERHAASLAAIVAALGSDYPRSPSARVRALGTLTKSERLRVQDLEEQFLGLLADASEDLERYRGRYVLEHPDDFVLRDGAGVRR